MKRRLSRAKAKIKATGIPFAVPGAQLLPDRLDAVLAVIYLIYNEGYSGRLDLGAEAIRLGRVLAALMPREPEAHRLLALMMIHHARRRARFSGEDLVLLDDQDRSLWDMRQIAGMYRRLVELTGSPVVELNGAVALAQADDPAAALRAVDRLDLDGYLYFHSTRGELLRRLGRDDEARAAYRRALDLATSTPERRFLSRRLEHLCPGLYPGRVLVRRPGMSENLPASGHATCSTTCTPTQPAAASPPPPAPRSRGTTSMEEPMHSAPATVAIPGYPVGTWKADPVHSEIAFSVRLLMVSKVRGRFAGYDVTIVTSEDPLGSSVAATIDLASIDTGNEPRDNHLRSADYLEVEKYPTMSYRSTGIRRTHDGWGIDGELTLRGVTRQVPLTVEVNGFGPDPFGGQRVGFSATAHINRRDFGITIPMDGGGVMVGGKVSISLEIEAVLQKGPDPDGLPHTGLLRAFPDLHVTVEDLIAEGDKVVCRNTVLGGVDVLSQMRQLGVIPAWRSPSTRSGQMLRMKLMCHDSHWSGNVPAMSSPEASTVGAFGHAVSPLNH